MNCPDCGCLNAPGAATCKDCGTALPVPESPDATGSYGGWDQVAETRQVYEAELMKLRLQSAGIDAQVVDQSFEQMPMPDVANIDVVRVLVPTDRAEEARTILAQPVDLPADGESDGNGENNA